MPSRGCAGSEIPAPLHLPAGVKRLWPTAPHSGACPQEPDCLDSGAGTSMYSLDDLGEVTSPPQTLAVSSVTGADASTNRMRHLGRLSDYCTQSAGNRHKEPYVSRTTSVSIHHWLTSLQHWSMFSGQDKPLHLEPAVWNGSVHRRLMELSKVKEVLLPDIGRCLAWVRCKSCLALHRMVPYNDLCSWVCLSCVCDFLSCLL